MAHCENGAKYRKNKKKEFEVDTALSKKNRLIKGTNTFKNN